MAFSEDGENSFSRALGRSRFVVLVAVVAVLLVAVSLFLQGAVLAVSSVWHSWQAMKFDGSTSTDLTVDFLEIVKIMLEAVVFYLIGIGLYSLFIAPLNLAISLGVETLSDLEDKLISVIIAIMATKFLERFIQWKKPDETLQFAIALSIVTLALVAFQWNAAHAKEEQKNNRPDTQARAQRDLFEDDNEKHHIQPDETTGTGRPDNESQNESQSADGQTK